MTLVVCLSEITLLHLLPYLHDQELLTRTTLYLRKLTDWKDLKLNISVDMQSDAKDWNLLCFKSQSTKVEIIFSGGNLG